MPEAPQETQPQTPVAGESQPQDSVGQLPEPVAEPVQQEQAAPIEPQPTQPAETQGVEAEQEALTQEGYQNQKDRLTEILKHGKLNYKSLKEAVGSKEKAQGIFKKLPAQSFSENAVGLDVLADSVGMELTDFVKFLEDYDAHGKVKVSRKTKAKAAPLTMTEDGVTYVKENGEWVNPNVDFMPDNSRRNDGELTEGTSVGENSREVSAVGKWERIDYQTLRTESGRSIEEADSSDWIVRSNGSRALGIIDTSMAERAAIASGEIHVNVGMVRHADIGNERGGAHGSQIREAGYENVLEAVADVLSSYTELRKGPSNNSILLVKRLRWTKPGKVNSASPVVIIGADLESDGAYHARTIRLERDSSIDKNKLLSARREPYTTDPASDVALNPVNPEMQGNSQLWSANQESNSHKTLLPPTKNVNSSDTDTEINTEGRPERGGPVQGHRDTDPLTTTTRRYADPDLPIRKGNEIVPRTTILNIKELVDAITP
ncbi:hypothetical protein FACS1894204_07390 [Synergistales bacterium]|nr:hypothetical protein FACS1894204_07390 [Synergistales bacterium]